MKRKKSNIFSAFFPGVYSFLFNCCLRFEYFLFKPWRIYSFFLTALAFPLQDRNEMLGLSFNWKHLQTFFPKTFSIFHKKFLSTQKTKPRYHFPGLSCKTIFTQETFLAMFAVKCRHQNNVTRWWRLPSPRRNAKQAQNMLFFLNKGISLLPTWPADASLFFLVLKSTKFCFFRFLILSHEKTGWAQ